MSQKTIKMAKVYELNFNSDNFTFQRNKIFRFPTPPATTCSKLTIETLEQKVKNVWCLNC